LLAHSILKLDRERRVPPKLIALPLHPPSRTATDGKLVVGLAYHPLLIQFANANLLMRTAAGLRAGKSEIRSCFRGNTRGRTHPEGSRMDDRKNHHPSHTAGKPPRRPNHPRRKAPVNN